jgi:hypothetical protein
MMVLSSELRTGDLMVGEEGSGPLDGPPAVLCLGESEL